MTRPVGGSSKTGAPYLKLADGGSGVAVGCGSATAAATVGVGGAGVAVGGAGVAVGGTGVDVGGTGVNVAVGAAVGVGGTGVALGGTRVAVAGSGVALGGSAVGLGGTRVTVGDLGTVTVTVAVRRTRVGLGVTVAVPSGPQAVISRLVINSTHTIFLSLLISVFTYTTTLCLNSVVAVLRASIVSSLMRFLAAISRRISGCVESMKRWNASSHACTFSIGTSSMKPLVTA